MGSSMPADDDVLCHFPGLFKQYKDGRVDRELGTETVAPCIDPQTGVESKDVVIIEETGLSARLYMPPKVTSKEKDEKKHCLIVYYHGGAFVCQTPFAPIYQPFINTIVSRTNAVCVSVHYRRAPEHLLPVAYDDSWAALKWVLSHSNTFGPDSEPWLSPNDKVDFGRVFLMGDSAGGNIAHQMAMHVGSEGFVNGRGELVKQVEGLLLIHPFFWQKGPVDDEDIVDPIVKQYTELLWTLICPSRPEPDNPWLNPVKDPEMPRLGCRRTSVFTAEYDYYKAKIWHYYKTLIKSRWDGVAEIEETPGEGHVFHLDKPDSVKSLDIIKRVISFVNILPNF